MKFSAIKSVFVIAIILCSCLLNIFSQSPDFSFNLKDNIKLLLFSADGKLLAAEDSSSFNLYDIVTGETRGKLDLKGFANSAIFSNDGKFIITGNNYGEVSIYETATLSLIKTFPVTRWSIYSLAISPDNQNLAVDIGDGTIEIWNIKDGEKINTLGEKGLRMKFMTFSSNGKLLASTNLESKITIWNLAAPEKSFSLSNYTLSPPVFCQLGTELAVANLLEVKFFNTKTGEILRTMPIPKENIPYTAGAVGGSYHGKVTLSTECKTIIISNYKAKTITLLDTKTKKTKQITDESEAQINSFMTDFSPPMNAIARGSTNGEVKLWKIK